MQWKLNVRNPNPGGGSDTGTVTALIQADNLSQAIERASFWINPDFRGFSLVRVK